MGHNRPFLLLYISSLLLSTCRAGTPFYDLFHVQWGNQNVQPDDATSSVEISLTADGIGATFSTNQTYLMGCFSAMIKLVPGNSQGTVAAFFLISNTDNHDEIDFEFLGNVSGEPYLLHTNVFSNGTGNREQDIYLWFDPTADFHTYKVLWNHKLILWFVDDIPVRVFNNVEAVAGVPFPNFRPMVVDGCIFDGSTWATEGGYVEINFSYAPFNVNFENFVFDACLADGNDVGLCGWNYEGNWWEGPAYQSFTPTWQNQMAWVRQHYEHYNYCQDPTRYPTPPPECAYNHDLA